MTRGAMAAQSAVNRLVVGSNPTGSASVMKITGPATFFVACQITMLQIISLKSLESVRPLW